MRPFNPDWKQSLSRSEVYEAISREREYQVAKWGSNHRQQQSVEGYLLILQREVNEAVDGWMKNTKGRDSALAEILQVAAVAVSCLEDHGTEGN